MPSRPTATTRSARCRGCTASSWPPAGRSTGSPVPAAWAKPLPSGSSRAKPPSTFTNWTSGASGPHLAHPPYLVEACREVYRYYYHIRYPNDENEWGRPYRKSPFYERLQDLGAVFGHKNGWERANYFDPGKPWRQAGAEQNAWGWARPAYSSQVAEEVKAARERVALFDMTSFGKIDVRGRGALALLQKLAANDLDRPVGSITYTQFLNHKGGIESDVTVTRVAENEFRIISGTVLRGQRPGVDPAAPARGWIGAGRGRHRPAGLPRTLGPPRARGPSGRQRERCVQCGFPLHDRPQRRHQGGGGLGPKGQLCGRARLGTLHQACGRAAGVRRVDGCRQEVRPPAGGLQGPGLPADRERAISTGAGTSPPRTTRSRRASVSACG